MFRSFLLSSRRLLSPRPVPWSSVTLEASGTGPVVIYDIRRNDHSARGMPFVSTSLRPSLLGSGTSLTVDNHIRWASSGLKSVEMPNPTVVACNMINMLKCVDLNDLKDAPPPAFWVGLTLGGLQLVIPFLEIIGGYSSVLTMYQLYSAAMLVAFNGGQKWGLALSGARGLKADWDTVISAAAPTVVSVLGLLAPYPIGFLMVGSSLFAALYLDLKACIYPPWGCALLVFMYLTTAVGLLLALSAYVLFNNNENKKKKIEESRNGTREEFDNKQGNGDKGDKPDK